MSDDGQSQDPGHRRSASEDSLEPGRSLGHYRIVRPLGRGGMGEVWLAEDTKLDRKVALKLLPATVVDNDERRARFEREAKAVAALNHPNIVTVHSIEELSSTDSSPSTRSARSGHGVHFITMEYVDGQTLSELIPRRGMTLDAFLDLAIPVADAMASAHGKGITHRDLKPANVMVGEDGRPKILDFGLAKLADDPGPAGEETVLGTRTMTTGSGTVLGTPSYMSPEQAEGKQVDARSDVFSLGIVLYEMATGERPFRGDTGVSIISSIVRETPASVTELNHTLPRHLGRIIKRCLAKDPLRRYQTALDLRNELEELKEELDSGELIVSGVPTAGARRGKWKTVLAVAAGAVTVFAAMLGYQAFRQRGRPGDAARPLTDVSFQQLTEADGHEFDPSLSPDGKWFVYAGGNWDDPDIYLQAVGGTNPIDLTPDSPVGDQQPAFSPDGDQIAFRSERDGGGIFVMGRTGESVRRITDAGYHPAWSPDGSRIAYGTGDFSDPGLRSTDSELWVVDIASGDTRRIVEQDAVQPHWSPSGRRIAFWGLRPGSGRRDVWTVAAEGGECVPVTDDPHVDWNPLWSGDGRYLYFASNRGGSMNLWRVPIDEDSGRVAGPFEPVTTPTQSVGSMAVSSKGNRIAYTAMTYGSNIQRVPFDPRAGEVTGDPIRITRSSVAVAVPTVSPDGEWIAYMTYGEQEDIFVMRADGSGRRQLTDDLHRDRAPAWSPDGTKIAFFSDRSGTYEIWTIQPDGAGLTQLTDTPGASAKAPFWSPDGTSMCCQIDDTHYLFDPRQPWDQQSPEAIPPMDDGGEGLILHSWSPDGAWLAGDIGDVGDMSEGVIIYSLETGEYRRLTDHGGYALWMRDGRGLFYATDAGSVRLVDLVTEQTKELLPAMETGWRAVSGISPDSRELYLFHVESTADIWLVTLD